MSDTSVIPGSLAVRNLFEDLLGRDVTVAPGTPFERADLARAVVAVYVDPAQQIAGVIGLDLSLAANAGAALGLLPAGAAQDALDEKSLTPMLVENVRELFNILTSLLNREGMPHVKLHQVVAPGQDLPSDAAAHLLALGRRLDLTMEVSRYGGGRFALTMAP